MPKRPCLRCGVLADGIHWALDRARRRPRPRKSARISRVVRGTVKTWHGDDGWGVLVSPEVAGEVFAHYSHIEAEGYRELAAGDSVDFEYEPFPEGQDEDQDVYYYRATRVMEAAPEQ